MPFGNQGMAALFLVFLPLSLSGDEISLSSSLEFFIFPLSFPVPSACLCGLSDMFVLSKQCLFPLPGQLFGIRVLCPCPVPCMALLA